MPSRDIHSNSRWFAFRFWLRFPSDFLCDFLSDFSLIDHPMNKIQRLETYFSPQYAMRYTGLSRAALLCYVRRGILTHYRTSGNHRRFALSELRALRDSLRSQS